MKTNISIITPLYYGKKYLLNIKDMLSQNIKESANCFSLELILVNDSPDEKITDKDVTCMTDFKVVLLTNSINRGIHYSRIHGLKHATGQYVMFFDQDDKIESNYFSSQLMHIQNADVVVANGIAQYPDYEKLLYRYWIMQWTVKHIWFSAKFGCRIISPGQCLIKRTCIPSVWKENILKNNGADDFLLWLILLSNRCQFNINRDRIYTHIYTSLNASENTEMMHKSEEEMLKIAKSIVKQKYVEMIENRMRDNDNSSIRYKLIRIIERINRK